MGARIRRYGVNQVREQLVTTNLTHHATAEQFGIGNARTTAFNAQGLNDVADGVGQLGDVATGIATNERRKEAIEEKKRQNEAEAEVKKMQAQAKAVKKRARNLELMRTKIEMVKGLVSEYDNLSNNQVKESTNLNNLKSSDGSKVGPVNENSGEGHSQVELLTSLLEKQRAQRDAMNLSEDEAYPIDMSLLKFELENMPKAIKADRAYQKQREIDLINADFSNDVEAISRFYDDPYAREDLLDSYELKAAKHIGNSESDPDIARERLKTQMGEPIQRIVQKFSDEGRFEEGLDILSNNRYRMHDKDAETLETYLEKNLDIQKQNNEIQKQSQAKLELIKRASNPEFIENPIKQAQFVNSLNSIEDRDLALKVIKQTESFKDQLELQQEQEFVAAFSKQTLEMGQVLPYLITEQGKVPIKPELYKKKLDEDNMLDQANPQTRLKYNEFMSASDDVKSRTVLGENEYILFGDEWFNKMVSDKSEAKARVNKLQSDNEAFKKTLPAMATNYAKSIFKSFAESKDMPGEEVFIMNNFVNMARISGTTDIKDLMALANQQIKYAEFDSNYMHLFGYDHGYVYQILSGDPDSEYWQEMEDAPEIPPSALNKLGGTLPKGTSWDGSQKIWRMPTGKCIDMFGNIGRAPKVKKGIYRKGRKYTESISDLWDATDDREYALPSNVLWSNRHNAYVSSDLKVMFDENARQIKVK